MNVPNECRVCFETTDQNQMISPCDCSGTMAHIHIQCLKNTIEKNGEEKCRICGQNWRGIKFVKKEKNFLTFITEKAIRPLIALIIIIFMIINEINLILSIIPIINHPDFEFLYKLIIIFWMVVSTFMLSWSSFALVSILINKYKDWRKVNFICIVE